MDRNDLKDKAFWADVPYLDEPVIKLSDALTFNTEISKRICINCKHWIEEHTISDSHCGHDSNVVKYCRADFGCNNWSKIKTRGDILEEVYKQIKEDVKVDDFTAIEQLLVQVDKGALVAFLPEERIFDD